MTSPFALAAARSLTLLDRLSLGWSAAADGSGLRGAGPAPAPGLETRVQVCRSAADLDALAADWQRLEAETPEPCLFASHAWCRHLLATLAAPADGAPIEAVIATCRAEGRLVGLWPLARQNHAGLAILTSLGAPFDQYADVLVARGHAAADVVPKLAMALRSMALADGMVLRKVRAGGEAMAIAGLGARIVDEASSAPRITLDTRRPFEDFLATVNAKTRKNLRNYANRLGRQGELVHTVRAGSEIGAELTRSFEARRGWLDQNGLSSAAFRDPRFGALVASLGGPNAGALGLIAFELSLDRRPIALQWGFVQQGRYTAFLSARDPEFEDYSAGRVHLQLVLEACHARGIGEIDLLVPAAPYKMTWTRNARPVVDLVWPWTARGRLVLDVFERHVRPRLKQLAGGLPLSVRRHVFRLVNH